jgi:[ribosomal protein S5]-alanine N-acetyltransferase
MIIRSPRLDLIPFSAELMDALIAGDIVAARRSTSVILPNELLPRDADDLEFFRMRRAQVKGDPMWAPWSLRGVVLRASETVIGTANFHGPPGVNDTATPGAVEIGYEIFPLYRNSGFATEVAQAMIEWAKREYDITHFISGIAPDNAASLRVNDKLGFAPTATIVDGERIFELRLGRSLERTSS